MSTIKFVKCLDASNFPSLKQGVVYEVLSEQYLYYQLKNNCAWCPKYLFVEVPTPKNFIEVPKPKKVYQHSRKQIINQLKDLSNTLVGRATFGRVHSLEEHEDAVLEVRDDLDLIISYLEQLKETD